jgi:hypothetical protein
MTSSCLLLVPTNGSVRTRGRSVPAFANAVPKLLLAFAQRRYSDSRQRWASLSRRRINQNGVWWATTRSVTLRSGSLYTLVVFRRMYNGSRTQKTSNRNCLLTLASTMLPHTCVCGWAKDSEFIVKPYKLRVRRGQTPSRIL